MDVATLIRTSRERAGLSQRELAARAGTSSAAVCFYERGDRVPRTDTLMRLITATGSVLELSVVPAPATIDLAANGRDLEDVLDLADHLPQKSDPDLGFPPFRSLAR